MDEKPHFDVFLAHNSLDKPLVRVIAERLKQRGLVSWLDEEEILPGQSFQDEIQKIIPQVKSAAIFIGSLGLGKWQALELKTFISQCLERNIPVIPVLLPGVENVPNSLLFLAEYNWVQFTTDIDDSETLRRLELGITQQKTKSEPISNLHPSPKEEINLIQLRDEKKSKEFIIDQFEEAIKRAEKYLNYLQLEKNATQIRVKQLEEHISDIETSLREEMNQKWGEVLDWLESEKISLAAKAGDYALAKFPMLKQEIENDEKSSRLFYWSVQKILEIICHSLYSEDSDILPLLEELFVPLSIIDAYVEALSYLKKRVQQKNMSNEVNNKINESLDNIKGCLEFLKKTSS